jgi:hypothetical protein
VLVPQPDHALDNGLTAEDCNPPIAGSGRMEFAEETPVEEPVDADGLSAADRAERNQEGAFSQQKGKAEKWNPDALQFVTDLFHSTAKRYKPKEVFDLMKTARRPNKRRRFGALSLSADGEPNPLKSEAQIAAQFTALVKEKNKRAALGSADASIDLLKELKCGCGSKSVAKLKTYGFHKLSDMVALKGDGVDEYAELEIYLLVNRTGLKRANVVKWVKAVIDVYNG